MQSSERMSKPLGSTAGSTAEISMSSNALSVQGQLGSRVPQYLSRDQAGPVPALPMGAEQRRWIGLDPYRPFVPVGANHVPVCNQGGGQS